MSQFKNFNIWRGRLPHWRADDVRYYVTFRHRRSLDEAERRVLLKFLVRPEGRRWDLLILVVLPERTELILTVLPGRTARTVLNCQIWWRAPREKPVRLSSRTQVNDIRLFTPESFDRIVRDEVELDEKWKAVLSASVNEELAESPDEYDALWVADSDSSHRSTD